jgi:FkbH-like protein
MSADNQDLPGSATAPAPVKCVVWDLDGTLWDGVLLEDDPIVLRPGAADAIRELDRRGILQSIASRNDHATVTAKLADLDLGGYFLVPQIHWGAKAASIEQIARHLDLSVDAIAFIDDDPFERAEVTFALPAVRAFDASQLADLLARPELSPRTVTDESRNRRRLYQDEAQRKAAESTFAGPPAEFLATLQLRLTIRSAEPRDLDRAEELTLRTHQLNATGVPYSRDQLDHLRRSPDHHLLVADLDDRFGRYGTIGLALLERGDPWTLKLLLTSCRVISRGVGAILLAFAMNQARKAGHRLQAEFVPTGRNRAMYVTYKFAGFQEAGKQGDLVILEADLTDERPYPPHVVVAAE